jgi:hypothetical protein
MERGLAQQALHHRDQPLRRELRLGMYVAAASQANAGRLPARYDGSSATFATLRRTSCKGSLCEP